MSARSLATLAVLATATVACAHAPAADAPMAERTLYELRVTNPGSRSQGVRGVLFDVAGQEVAEDGAGQSVETPVGRFHYVACRNLWSVCGYFRDGSQVAAYPGPTLDTSRSSVMMWRITLSRGVAETRWAARLFDERNVEVTAPLHADSQAGDAIDTPLGLFRSWRGRLAATQGQGPVPTGWPEIAAVPR